MFVSHKALNGRQLATGLFFQVEEGKRRILAEEEARAGATTVITTYGISLSPVSSLKYLYMFLLASHNEWTEVVPNLRREQQKWALLTRVLVK